MSIENKQPQINQVNEQLSNNIAATVLVERTNGDIDTAHVFDRGVEGKVTAYLEPDSEGYAAQKTIGSEKLSDEHQQKLAKDLAGVALRSETDLGFDAMFGKTDPNRKPEDAAVRGPKLPNNEDKVNMGLGYDWRKNRASRDNQR
jgi:hypothetical protein